MTLTASTECIPCLRLSRVPDVLLVIGLFVAAGVIGFLVVHQRHATRCYHPRITLAETKNYVASGDVLIFDARDHESFLAGHLPGAVSLSPNEWDRRIHELRAVLNRSRDQLVIVYCANEWCGQAEELQQRLIEFGLRRVGVFPEGFDAWRRSGGMVALP